MASFPPPNPAAKRNKTPYRIGPLEGAVEGSVPLTVRQASLPRIPSAKLPAHMAHLANLGRNQSVPLLGLDRIKNIRQQHGQHGSLGSVRVNSGKIRLAPLTNGRSPSEDGLGMNEVLLRRLQLTKQRYIRIFLSSTFRGMEEERECLTKKYFKELRHQCEQAGIFFTIVDLRWGITDVDSKNAET
eukprot:Opistho-2@39337